MKSKTSSSAGALIGELEGAVRRELLDGLRPALDSLTRAVGDLESALGDAKPRRGRPPKAAGSRAGAARRGRPPGRRRPGRPAKKKTAARKRRAASGRTPRGALAEAVRQTLASGGPLKLSEIRDRLLKTSEFRGRNPKTLYIMIVVAVKKLADVQKTADGRYKIK
jgi:hypothetical protein